MKALTKNECLKLLGNNYIGRIGYISKGVPEVVPITYCYDAKEHAILTYSGEGGKIESMRINGNVSFQVDEIRTVLKWKSVLLYGEYVELSGIDAKHQLHVFSEGVKKTILKKEGEAPKFISEFSSKLDTGGMPIVYRIQIHEIKGRQRGF